MPPRVPAPELPGFTLIDWLGGGGFADVFRYSEHALGREVAIKVLHHGVTDKALAAFKNEASLMAKLSSHPNIVSIFQVGAATDGRPYLVMEMCRPQHLGDHVARRLYTPAKAMEVGIQIAGAVETAHRLGILHRDIKPANILFTDFGRPALADFGISVSVEQGASASSAMSPQWAAPEQFGHSSVGLGPWSDVYSLAATIWASMVGHSPMYVASEPNDVLHLNARARTMPAPRTGRADVPEELERVLAVGMAKDPGQRFQSAIEFARALQGVQGAINQAVTSIDVFTEQEQIDYGADTLEQEGTRVQGFMLVDPEQTDATANVTGPTSGMTTPLERTGTYQPPQHNPNLVQHGWGVATPGLREFTMNSWPEVTADPTVASQSEGGAVAEAAPKKAPIGLIVSASLLLVAALVIGVVFVLNQGKAATTADSTASPSPTSKPVDPLANTVPEVTDVTATVEGDQVTFTWTNPDPQDGDQYRYAIIDVRGDTVSENTAETQVTVTAEEGTTCIDVALVRANGRSSKAVRGCTP